MSESINPYAPPAAKIVGFAKNPCGTWAVLVSAWTIFRARFGVIVAVGLLVWTPCELLSSYLDYFVFDPSDFNASYHCSRLLYYLVGVIATGGIVQVALSHSSGSAVTVGKALRAGFRAWLRMGWTVFLSDALLVFSFVLLVLPLFYLLPRLLLIESVVVCEGLSGNAAIERSFSLTRGHYWKVFGFMLISLAIAGAWFAIPWVLAEFAPLPDHWLADAAFNVLGGFFVAFETILMVCLYRGLSQSPVRAGDVPATEESAAHSTSCTGRSTEPLFQRPSRVKDRCGV